MTEIGVQTLLAHKPHQPSKAAEDFVTGELQAADFPRFEACHFGTAPAAAVEKVSVQDHVLLCSTLTLCFKHQCSNNNQQAGCNYKSQGWDALSSLNLIHLFQTTTMPCRWSNSFHCDTAGGTTNATSSPTTNYQHQLLISRHVLLLILIFLILIIKLY